MQAALARYHHQGLYAIDRSSAAAMDRLSTAAKQLPHADNEASDSLQRVDTSFIGLCFIHFKACCCD